MTVTNVSQKKPDLILEQYFLGKTFASGIFEDRFGNVRRQFTVDIDGTWDGKTLTLTAVSYTHLTLPTIYSV